MATTRGKRIAGEREWGRRDHDGRVRDRASFRTERVYKRVWLWSREPYARDRRLLWVKVVVGYRYFDTDGREVVPFWLQRSQ